MSSNETGTRSAGQGAASVVVTTHNDAHFLADALSSVVAQTFPVAEIILVADGSDDDLSHVTDNFPNVILVRIAHQGLAAARNAGLAKATSPFIAFLDADDVLTPNGLEAGLECMAANPGAGLVFGAHSIVDADLRLVDGPFVHRIGPLAHRSLLRENVIGMHGAVLYDRAILAELGGFDQQLQRCEDYELYLRMTRQCRIASHGNEVARYRLHGANMSLDAATMLDWNNRVLDLYRPADSDRDLFAAWTAGKRALPRSFANLAWKNRGLDPPRKRAERGKLMRIAPLALAIAALRQTAARTLPRPLLNLARTVRKRATSLKTGTVDFGDLARLRPIDPYFGFDRGTPIDRHYIEAFLRRHASDITGHVLEVGDAAYSERYGQDIAVQDVLNSTPGHSATTLVGDLSVPGTLPEAAFDAIVITQTLQLIYDLKMALAQLHSALKPGGVVLATVPGISPLADTRWDWFWMLTGASATRLFADAFGADNVEVEVAGNVFAATAFLYGIAVEEVGAEWLDPNDPAYPVIISIAARKPA